MKNEADGENIPARMDCLHYEGPFVSGQQSMNLRKLSQYLRLHAVQEHFHMGVYYKKKNAGPLGQFASPDRAMQPPKLCGTVACALGHGPAAGVDPFEDWLWRTYSRNKFGMESYSKDWEFVFGPDWEIHDNTPAGAADRIDYYLVHGTPDCTMGAWCLHRETYLK